MVSLLNLQELLPPILVHDIELTIRLHGHKFKRAILLPEFNELKTDIKNDAVNIKLPPLEILHILMVEFE